MLEDLFEQKLAVCEQKMHVEMNAMITQVKQQFAAKFSELKQQIGIEFVAVRKEMQQGFTTVLEKLGDHQQHSQRSASPVTRSAGTTASFSSMAAVNNSSSNSEEAARASNLLARNMEQPATEQNSELKTQVVEMICSLFDSGDGSTTTKEEVEQSIVSVQRVGNNTGRSTPLPVKIVFKTVEHKVSVHRSAYRLGQPNSKFKGISLDSDITQDQQYSRQLLRAELAKANNLVSKDIRISWSCNNPLRATKVKLPNGEILPRLSQQHVQAAVY